ncbi:hypothetical protein EW146_g6496 [Bondarzewia mesenterica]|uniref:Uncharacterized protein n=1 Tax=Bondarzewia mesenterica TaxID=1095465 RepID=A0A4S4LQG0_9AGAM|nr:hypothetical protein EW146_g6496 [Bondarzewia mesenterica]
MMDFLPIPQGEKKAKVTVSPIPEKSADADADADANIEAKFNTGNAKLNKTKMVVLPMPKEIVDDGTNADADIDTKAPAPVSKRKRPQVIVLPIALVRKAQREDMPPHKKSRKCHASPADEADTDAEVEQGPRLARKRKPMAKALASQAATAGKGNRRK